MNRIQFRAKVQTVHYARHDAPDHMYIQVPELKRSHCDMNWFRRSRRFGSYANSDLFLSMLKREMGRMGVESRIRLDRPFPAGVTVDTSGFLALVTIEVPDTL